MTPGYADCRRLWLAGLCPCCGLDLDDDDPVIAEGVRLCELCEMRGHHRDTKHVAQLLAALVPLTDDQYAEMQAEHLAAADLDPDWPVTYE